MERAIIKQQQHILNYVKSQSYQIYRLRLSLGKCDHTDINKYLDLIIKSWKKIGRNPKNVFRRYSKGLIKAYGIDIDSNVYEPYIELFFLDLAEEDFAYIEKCMLCNWITMTQTRIEPFSILKIPFELFKELLLSLAIPEGFDISEQNIKLYGCIANINRTTDYLR